MYAVSNISWGWMPQQWFMEKMISQEWEVILFWNTIENINCQILRKVHIVTYKIFHQFYMVTTIAKPDTDYE
jgi:hypothetical protein